MQCIKLVNGDETQICPLCEGSDNITDLYTGEIVCTDCGCVIETEPTCNSHFKYNYKEHQQRRRTGSPLRASIFDKGMGTVMDGTTDAYGRKLDEETLSNLRRLQTQDKRSKLDETELRNLSVAMSELDRIIFHLGLPNNVKETAAKLYRETLSEDMIRGRSIDNFITASIYLACRLLKLPWTLRVIVDAGKRPYDEVSMTYRLMIRELEIVPPVDTAAKYIPVMASNLGLSRVIERDAVKLLGIADTVKALVGKDPKGVAAAALYIICQRHNHSISQRELSEVSGVTEITIRNRSRGLRNDLGLT